MKAAHRRGGGAAHQRRRDQGQGARRRRAERHRVPGRDRQDRGRARRCTAPTCRARACSATCCRSSRARRWRPSTAWSRPITSCSSRRARSIFRSRPTSSPSCRAASRSGSSSRSLSVADFEKILTATDACLTRQYAGAARHREGAPRLPARRHPAAGRDRVRGQREAGEHRRAAALHGDGAAARRRLVPRGEAHRRTHRRSTPPSSTRRSPDIAGDDNLAQVHPLGTAARCACSDARAHPRHHPAGLPRSSCSAICTRAGRSPTWRGSTGSA